MKWNVLNPILIRANVQGKDIYMYADTKKKFATSSSMKKQDFKAAVDQIEAALQGDDPVPDSYDVMSAIQLQTICIYICIHL